MKRKASGGVRVLVADDHPLIFEAVRRVLEDEPGIRVIGLALTGIEAVKMTIEHKPDVVLMDIRMPGLGGIDATTHICARLPDTRVIGLSMDLSDSIVRAMIQAGARGYLAKDCASTEIMDAITTVVAGEMYFSKSISHRICAGYCLGDPSGVPLAPDLSPAERDLLRMIAEDLSTKEIAERMKVSDRAVEKQKERLKEKLKVRGLAGLVRCAFDEGIVPHPSVQGNAPISPQ